MTVPSSFVIGWRPPATSIMLRRRIPIPTAAPELRSTRVPSSSGPRCSSARPIAPSNEDRLPSPLREPAWLPNSAMPKMPHMPMSPPFLSPNTQKVPVRNVVGDDHMRERIAQFSDLVSGYSLFDPGKETVVDILLNPAQAFGVIKLVQGDIAAQLERPQDLPHPYQRLIEQQRPRAGNEFPQPGTADPAQNPSDERDRAQENPEIHRAIVKRVIEKDQETRCKAPKTPHGVKAGQRQMMQHAQAQDEVAKIFLERKRLQIAHKEQSVPRGSEVLPRNKNGVGKVDQDDFPTDVLQEMTPPTAPAPQVADTRVTERIHIKQIEVLRKFLLMFRKDFAVLFPFFPEGELDILGETRAIVRPSFGSSAECCLHKPGILCRVGHDNHIMEDGEPLPPHRQRVGLQGNVCNTKHAFQGLNFILVIHATLAGTRHRSPTPAGISRPNC